MRALLLRERDQIRTFAPYSPAFVEDLKAEIPYSAKRWDGDARNWVVSDEYEEVLLEVASRYFEIDMVVTQDEALRREQPARKAAANTPPPPPPHGSSECARIVRNVWREQATLYLLPDAPQIVIDAAYRALVKILHPDVSGSHSNGEMVRLNLAYDVLKKRVTGAPR